VSTSAKSRFIKSDILNGLDKTVEFHSPTVPGGFVPEIFLKERN